jgi:Stigma-specific protein, Stig1
MRSPWLLGAAALIALNACGPPREELPTRDGTVRTDATADTGVPGMDGGAACPTGATRCGTDCVNLQTSNVHCGACNARCTAPQTCMAGRCMGTVMCTGGQMNCGGTCVDVTNNNANCGACGRMCAAGQTCSMGMCMAGGCAAPRMMCGASCIDVQTNAANCGRCGNACPAGQSCQAGTCRAGAGMCAPTCTTDTDCTTTCPVRAGYRSRCFVDAMDPRNNVCIEEPEGTGPVDGGTGSGGDGGVDLFACLFGTATCADNAECAAKCPGIATTCSGGTCE